MHKCLTSFPTSVDVYRRDRRRRYLTSSLTTYGKKCIRVLWVLWDELNKIIDVCGSAKQRDEVNCSARLVSEVMCESRIYETRTSPPTNELAKSNIRLRCSRGLPV